MSRPERNRFQTSATIHTRVGGSTAVTLVIVLLIAAFGVFLLLDPGSKPTVERNPPDARGVAVISPETPQPEPPTPATQPQAPPPTAANPVQVTQLDAPPVLQPTRPAASPLEVDRSEVDFGYVLIGQPKVKEVVLFNPSDIPLNVDAVHVSCPCTTAEVSPRRIDPGGAAVLRIEYEAQAYAHVPPARSIRIQLREYPREMTQIIMRAAVGREIRLNSDRQAFLNEMSGVVRIESHDGEPFRVLLVDGMAPDFVDFDPESDELQSEYLVRYNFTLSRAGRGAPRFLHVLTDRADGPMTDILTRFAANFREPLQAEPRSWLSESPILHLGIQQHGFEPTRRTILLQRTRSGTPPQLEAAVRPATGMSTIGPETGRDPQGHGVVDAKVVQVASGTRSGDYLVTIEFTAREGAPAGLHNDVLTIIFPDAPEGAVHFTEIDLITYIQQ